MVTHRSDAKMRKGLLSLFIAWFCVLLFALESEAFAPMPRGNVAFQQQTTRTPWVRSTALLTAGLVRPSPRNYSLVRLTPLSVNGLLTDGSVGNLIDSLFRYSGQVPFVQAFAINAVLFSAFKDKLLSALTPAGFIHSMVLGTMLWTTLGWRGWSYCVLYLILGQGVTKVGFADKEKRGIAESRGGRRGPENVWGSAATSLICAICSIQGESFLGLTPNLFVLGFVAALATKLADTFASEIGKAYGKTTFLITTLERVEPGTEGAISAEGTAAAALGGFLLSVYAYSIGFIDLPSIAISTVAAFLATNVESLIGATIQGKDGFSFMTNEAVNFVNTLIGGSMAIVAGKVVLGM
jgi:uncharacterized protein (TIGR00297 family)